MPADNEMPDFVRADLDRSRVVVEAWKDSPQWTPPFCTTLAWLADYIDGLTSALDKAQRERDDEIVAFGAWLTWQLRHDGPLSDDDVMRTKWRLTVFRASTPTAESKA